MLKGYPSLKLPLNYNKLEIFLKIMAQTIFAKLLPFIKSNQIFVTTIKKNQAMTTLIAQNF